MIKKIRGSLTVKICVLIGLLLLAVSGITYMLIAKFLPAFYSSQLEEGLDAVSQEMVGTIEQHRTIEEADTALELFAASSQATVIVLDDQGDTVWPSVEVMEYESEAEETFAADGGAIEDEQEKEEDVLSAGTAEAALESVLVQDYETAEGTAVSVMEGADGIVSVVDYGGKASAIKHYEMKVGGQNYVMLVMGGMQQVNQAMEILRRIFPYILGVILCIALLFALAASLYLTAPVVRLSRISRKMAELEFGEVYRGRRTDEIGKLGRNLNVMASNLSRTLVNLQQANAALKSDIERERELERKRIAFFSAVSHELKTPITILKGHISGMLQGVGAYQNRDYYLERAQRTTETMEEMVGELLAVSRMESRPFTRKKTDLAEQLRLLLADMAELMEKKGIALSADIPDHLEAEVNPGMLGNVFRNLLMNAVRYTPADEGNEIRIRLSRENGVVCSVENTGVQIPEEAIPRLFEAFYRVDQSRNRQSGGSGLGLYIVRMALEQHGAVCCAENTGDGVRFSFTLPD